MTVYVFSGPTLDAATGRREIDAVFLPPVSQGDVYRVTLKRPTAIGIIDGRFQDVPAVWHKEILWALSQGVAVYGSASMGALRAAELAVFGMRGVGSVFEAYRDGLLEDDDEVAVAHAGAEDGFAPTSEAMVNIRRTFARATADGVISADAGARLTTLIKEVFYPLRGYRLVHPPGATAGLSNCELGELAAWLPDHRIDQKRADALAMLRRIRSDLGTADATQPATFAFEHTHFFERLRRSAGELVLDAPDGGADAAADVTLEDLLDELRLEPDVYAGVRGRAMARCLAIRENARMGDDTTDADLRSAADRFRRSRALNDPASTRQWLADNHLGVGQFTALIREEHVLQRVEARVVEGLDIHLRSQLRVDGRYPDFAQRVRQKRGFLAAHGLADPATPIDLPSVDLVRWFCAARGVDLPADLGEYARSLGFADQLAFTRALQREYSFRTALRAAGAEPEHHKGRSST